MIDWWFGWIAPITLWDSGNGAEGWYGVVAIGVYLYRCWHAEGSHERIGGTGQLSRVSRFVLSGEMSVDGK